MTNKRKCYSIEIQNLFTTEFDLQQEGGGTHRATRRLGRDASWEVHHRAEGLRAAQPRRRSNRAAEDGRSSRRAMALEWAGWAVQNEKENISDTSAVAGVNMDQKLVEAGSYELWGLFPSFICRFLSNGPWRSKNKKIEFFL